MEIDWLEDFMTLSVTGVFARAAEARNISQPAFTRRIKNLEYWVGTPLIDRSVHPVELTPAGRIFLSTANETLQSLRLGREEANGVVARRDETMNFVALHTLAINFFPRWITEIECSFGTIKSRLLAENHSGCIEALLSGSSDLMLCYSHPAVPAIYDEERYPSLKIAEDRLVAISAPDRHGRAKFALRGDAPSPHLTYSTDSFLGRVSASIIERNDLTEHLEFHYENSMSEALKAAALAGRGLVWLPEIAIENELKSGALVKLSTPEEETTLSIKLYRSIERSRSNVERLWSFAMSRVL